MATCVRENARRATLAGTPSRSTQAGARHRERAELTFFFPSSPLISAIAVLSSSPSPVSPSSTTVDATTIASASSFAFLHSDFHRPQHRSPSSSATVAVLFSSHLLASVAILPVSSITVTFPLPFPPPPSPPSILPLRSPRLNAVVAPLFPLHLVTVPAVSFSSPRPLCLSLPSLSQPPSPPLPSLSLFLLCILSPLRPHPGKDISVFIHRHGLHC